MQYRPEIERWRATVAKYFPPELVDKALYVIQGESGGNAAAKGDNGVAIGLFQIQDKTNFSNRPDAAYLSDPENNIAYAAKELGAAGGNWGAWGEGSSYNGQKFGALGNNPYPGDTGGTTVTQPGNGHFADPSQDADYTDLRQTYLAAKEAMAKAGNPDTGPLWTALDDATQAYFGFVDKFGYPTSTKSNTDPAQQAFENRISAGDFETRQADSAFKKWYEKYAIARTAVQDTLTEATTRNAENTAIVQAREQAQDPSLIHRGSGTRYNPKPQRELMDEYLKKAGISREAPTYQGSGVTMPGAAGAAASATTPGTYRLPTDGLSPVDPNKGTPSEAMLKTMNDAGVRETPNALSGGPSDMFPDASWAGGTGGNGLDWLGHAAGRATDSLLSGGFGLGAAAVTAGVKGNKAVKKWWQRRGFAEGGQNIPAGRAWVGEKGPETMEVPGFGSRIVGQQGPEEMDIPEGANITPVNEQFAMHQIQTAVREGPNRDRMQQAIDQRARANDPQLREKVLASLKKAMASEMATNPPKSPVLGPGVKDRWAPWRQLNGMPATAEEAAMQQQAAGKGAK